MKNSYCMNRSLTRICAQFVCESISIEPLEYYNRLSKKLTLRKVKLTTSRILPKKEVFILRKQIDLEIFWNKITRDYWKRLKTKVFKIIQKIINSGKLITSGTFRLPFLKVDCTNNVLFAAVIDTNKISAPVKYALKHVNWDRKFLSL